MVYHIVGGKWDDSVDVNDQHSWIEVLEGDHQNIRLIDATQDDGILITKKGWTVGRPMQSEGMPTKVIRKGVGLKTKPLLDVEGFFGQFLVNDKFKDIVEGLEPGVHQFFPMELYVGDEYQRTDYFFNICNRLDTMDREQSFPINARGFYRPQEGEPHRLVFSTAKIGNHHAWRDKCVPGGAAYISNELAQSLQDAGITGIGFHPREEI